MPAMAMLASAAIGAGGQIFGGLLGNRAQKWQQNAMVNVLNTLNQYATTGTGQAGRFQDAAAPNLSTLMQLSQFGVDIGPLLKNLLTENATNVRNDYQNNRALPAYFDSVMDTMRGRFGGLDGAQNVAQNIIARGGQTDLSAGGANLASILAQGGSPSQQAQLGAGTSLLANGGATDLTRQGAGAAGNIIGAGGNTGTLDALTRAGLAGVNGGGLTPTGMAGEATALNTLRNFGANQASDFATQRGMDITSKDPILSLAAAASLAKDKFATQFRDAAETAKAKAKQRGGEGSIVSGLENSDLADFMNSGLTGEADALRNALNDQQKLTLTQFGQGADLMNQGQNQANQRYSIASGLLSNLEDIATKRFGVSGSMASDAQGQASNRLLSAIQSLTGLQGVQNQGMAIGGNLLQDFNQSQLGGMGQLANFLGLDQNNLFSAMGANNTMFNSTNALINQYLQNSLSQGGFNLNNLNSMYGNLGQNLGAFQNLMNSSVQGALGGANGMNDMARAWLGLTSQAIGGMPGIFRNYRPQNPLGDAFSQAGAGIGKAVGTAMTPKGGGNG